LHTEKTRLEKLKADAVKAQESKEKAAAEALKKEQEGLDTIRKKIEGEYNAAKSTMDADAEAFQKLKSADFDLSAEDKAKSAYTATKKTLDAANDKAKASEKAFKALETKLAPFKAEWDRRENQRKEKEAAATKKQGAATQKAELAKKEKARKEKETALANAGSDQKAALQKELDDLKH